MKLVSHLRAVLLRLLRLFGQCLFLAILMHSSRPAERKKKKNIPIDVRFIKTATSSKFTSVWGNL